MIWQLTGEYSMEFDDRTAGHKSFGTSWALSITNRNRPVSRSPLKLNDSNQRRFHTILWKREATRDSVSVIVDAIVRFTTEDCFEFRWLCSRIYS